MNHFSSSIDRVFKDLDSSPAGLTQADASIRLAKHGPNELKAKSKTPAWLQFLLQFKDFMTLILIAAAVLSGIVGDMADTWIILVIVLLNATVGFLQTYRAEKAMDALKQMTVTQALVLRDGKEIMLPAKDLVPGDVVLLEAGNVIPADIRLAESHSFRVDESSLTGESVPAEKSNAALADTELPLGDQTNMSFKGTLVTHGRAKGIVVATGMQTELGRIAGMLQEAEAATPLQERMERFGKNLSFIILGICAMLFVSGLIRGEDTFEILLLSISLAVAAIPEALPALITVALSRGASRLAKKNALVRKLPAVETLGAVSFICSDKTGTLTQNRMKVVQVLALPNPDGVELLHQGLALNHDVKFNEKGEPFGEPTELALVEHFLSSTQGTAAHALHQHPRMAELPFDSDRKCMTTVHHFQGRLLVVTKGASESISLILRDTQQASTLSNQAEQWAAQGMRVLAYAYRLLDSLPTPFTYMEIECDMHYLGLVGMMDPPREEVKIAIAECRSAGITPVMITGDHPATAKAIAKEIGILDEKGLVLTGAELQRLSDESFLNMVEHVAVYARVSPDQKLRIVRALQRKGHYLAMTGDGVNDAPALRAANIGVAMGINGTDVSKEAAHLILLDDNFATIVSAVKEGRRIFDNIRKFVKYIMTCNGAEIWTIFLAPLLGMPSPLLPIHILWINLVTDGLPALALANEKAEIDAMKRPPRIPSESLFSEGLGYHILWVGALMAAVTLGTQAWALHKEMAHWQTMVFTVLSLSQLGHVLAVRSERTFLYRQGIFSNLTLLSAVALTFALQMAVIYLPFLNDIFNTAPLSLPELGFCIGASVIVFHAVELEKWVKGRG